MNVSWLSEQDLLAGGGSGSIPAKTKWRLEPLAGFESGLSGHQAPSFCHANMTALAVCECRIEAFQFDCLQTQSTSRTWLSAGGEHLRCLTAGLGLKATQIHHGGVATRGVVFPPIDKLGVWPPGSVDSQLTVLCCRMLDDFGQQMENTQSRLDNVMKKLAKVSHMTSGNITSTHRPTHTHAPWLMTSVSLCPRSAPVVRHRGSAAHPPRGHPALLHPLILLDAC